MLSQSYFLNDGTAVAPRLSVFLNLDNLVDLRHDSIWPGLDGLPRYLRLKADGFEGVQLTNDGPSLPGAPLPHCGLHRIDSPSDADDAIAKHAARGDVCVTVHAGWGLEDDDQVFHLVEAILSASTKYRLPVFIETHRATITQDIWRTVQITKRFPDVRFNGDFSHYYCGQELVYGDWAAKLAFLEPVLARIGFLHGRIASPGCIQVAVDSDLSSRPQGAHGVVNYFEHFKELWLRSMLGFLRVAVPGDILIFAPELLAGTHYYARLFPDSSGRLVEETDRYAQALLYQNLARSCFAEAQQILNSQQSSQRRPSAGQTSNSSPDLHPDG